MRQGTVGDEVYLPYSLTRLWSGVMGHVACNGSARCARSLLLVFDELTLKTSGRCITESTVQRACVSELPKVPGGCIIKSLQEGLRASFVLVGLMGLGGVMS